MERSVPSSLNSDTTPLERRFRFEDLLCAEGEVETWRGRRRATDELVVIKTAPRARVPRATQRWIEGSVAMLRELDRPELPAPREMGEEAGRMYVIRPYIRGQTLAEAGAMEIERAISIASAILESLQSLDDRALVHADLKPSNVVISQGNADPAPTLLDCGLARTALFGGALDGLSLDAVRYMPPEQTGLLERGIDIRTDIYAVGLLLFESLTGEPAFANRTLTGLLRSHLTEPPPAAAAYAPRAPPALDRVLARMLKKDPRDRYQTPGGARADLEAIVSSLRRGDADAGISVGARDERSTITEPAFTGRSEELASLEDALREARSGRGGLALIEGESGAGKTWLLQELARRATHEGAWVLRGRGRLHVAAKPFPLLSQLAREIAASAHAGRRERVSAAAVPVVAAALPELASLLGGPADAPPLDVEAEDRTLAALSDVLDALGAPDEPALIVVDDAQWADDVTLRLLERWRDAPLAGGERYVFIACAYRPEEVSPDHRLSKLAGRRVRLRAFSDDEMRAQVYSMAGGVPRRAADIIADHAAGNPLLVTAGLHGLIETGALVRRGPSWELADDDVRELQIAGDFAGLLFARLTRISPRARKLLAVGALIGRTFDPAVASELSGMDPQEAIRAVHDERGNLVWITRTGACTFFHDRIREALRQELSGSERRRLHLEIARRVGESEPDRDFALAYHLDQAGEPARALPHALAAAEAARSRYDMEVAERYYRIAERGLVAGRDARSSYRLARGLGEILLLRSKYDEADDKLQAARQLASDDGARADIEERLSQLALKRGQLRAAAEHGERALRMLGRYVPRTSTDCGAVVLWELGAQALHTYFPRHFVARRALQEGSADLFAARVHNGLNGPYFFSRGAVWILWTHLKALNLGERYPPTAERGREYGVHGSALAGLPRFFDRAVRYTRAGADICAERGDLWGRARALHFHSLSLCATARYDEAVESGLEAGRLFERAGDIWEADGGMVWSVMALYRKGDLKGAADLAARIYERSREIDNVQGIAFAVDPWVRALEGDFPAEILHRELERPGGHLQTSSLIAQAEAVRLLREDRAAEAEDLLAFWLRRMKKERALIHEGNHSLVIYLLQAQRRRAEIEPATRPRRREAILARARRTAREALRTARGFRNSAPHALREAAMVDAMCARPASARKKLDRSVAAARSLGARFELAVSQDAFGRLGGELAWRGAEGARDRGRAELAAIRAPLTDVSPAAPTLSVVDRFREILATGRSIVGALDEEVVASSLREGLLSLLRGQRASVYALGPSLEAPADPSEISPETLTHLCGDAEPITPGILQATLDAGAVVVRAAPGTGRTSDAELGRAGVRAALCAPVRVRERIAALAYVTHGEVTSALGEEERRIAEFLTTLAGAALENAEGFRQIRELSRELEDRVEARTAELAERNEELAESLRRLSETQDQLLHAGRMAAVGNLVAGLSHELNNPLAVVVGQAENLLRVVPEDEDAVRRGLNAIERQAVRAADLVRSLLDFSRSGPGERELSSPKALVDVAAELVTPEARERGVELRAHPEDEGPLLSISRRELESALVNLATNAIEATPEGGVVEIEARPEAGPGSEAGLAFRVRDSGTGIDEGALPDIFDPFFTTKPEGEGTGLGLSLARQAAVAHGGDIEIEHTSREGTTIRLWVPTAPRGSRGAQAQ